MAVRIEIVVYGDGCAVPVAVVGFLLFLRVGCVCGASCIATRWEGPLPRRDSHVCDVVAFYFPLGMNPGMPVSTTALNLILDVIPSLISWMAS